MSIKGARPLYNQDRSPTIPTTKSMTHGVGKVYRTVCRIRMYLLMDGGLVGRNVEPGIHMLLVAKNYARGTGDNQASIYTRYKFLLDDQLYMVKIPTLGPARENVKKWFVLAKDTEETQSENESKS